MATRLLARLRIHRIITTQQETTMQWYQGPEGAICAYAYCKETKAFHRSDEPIKRLNDKHELEEIHLDVNTVQFHIDAGTFWINAYVYTDQFASPAISDSSNSRTAINVLGPMCLLAPNMYDLIGELANYKSDSKELAGWIQKAKVICSNYVTIRKTIEQK